MLDSPYDPKTIDAAAQDLWERLGVHRFDPAATGEVYAIDTPPPTVSGSLHIGHVFSYTQAECIARYQRMRGKNVFYPFGFDGNGLPTERLAEKEHGVLGRSMPRPEFVALCLATSRRYEAQFEALWRRLGVSADWSLVYSTIDERCLRISQRGFLDLFAKGEVYLKTSPTLWDTETQTAVAQAELEAKEKKTLFSDIRFDLEGGGSLTIATTRPELLAACVAVFVHPDDPRHKSLVGRNARVPLFGHPVRVRADEKVDPAKGTGVVMCCTFGDKTDVEWYQKHSLDLRQAIGADGRMTELAGPESGLYANQARKAVLERLAADGALLQSREIEHVVQTYERTGREVEFLPTRQWFVRVLDKKADLIRLGDEVRWFPAHMGKRYRNWVEGLEWDWCISRQRFFGVPFPVWYCERCEAVRVARDAELPVDPTTRAPDGACACGATAWRPERDVMDTWATSSETPQINARWGDPPGAPRCPLPMALRPQAHDIIRTWAFYTIAKSWLHHRRIPWRDAMISGHVQAQGKQKISKSKGNAPIDPSDLIQEHGADAVRYWALSATLGNDYVYSAEDLSRGRALGVKLWNAARLAAQHLQDFDPQAPPAPPEAAERWIRARLAATVRAVTADLDAYEFGTAKGKVEQLFWNDVCDNYLELLKGRLHDQRPEAAAPRRAAQAGLYDALSTVLRLFAPFVPHVTEVLWQTLFAAREQAPSLGKAPWPAPPPAWADAEAEAQGAAAVAVLSAVRRWRSENKVSPGVPLARAHLKAGATAAARWLPLAGDVKAALRVADLTVDDDAALTADAVTVAAVTTA